MNFIRYFCYWLFSHSNKHIWLGTACLIIMPSVGYANTYFTPQSCFDYLPSDASTHGSFYICKATLGGKTSLYACHNFISRYGYYRVFFKSGRFPKAIIKTSKSGKTIRVLWSDLNNTDKAATRPEYNFQPPKTVPASSRFIGAGICKDEQDINTPCSAFRFNAARNREIKDYLILYKKDGSGPDSHTSIQLGPNHHAMPAEMAYQIGLNLLDTVCCQERAGQYLDYAASLFPESLLYQKAALQHQLKDSK